MITLEEALKLDLSFEEFYVFVRDMNLPCYNDFYNDNIPICTFSFMEGTNERPSMGLGFKLSTKQTVFVRWSRVYYLYEKQRSRLDGPAIIYKSLGPLQETIYVYDYFINDKSIQDEEDYWNHPLVLKAKLAKVLEL